jgi:hypothetical protein
MSKQSRDQPFRNDLTGLTAILSRSVKVVPAMKYAIAVAGIAATVALVTAFHLNYSIAIVGSLFTVGMMYVIFSFSRFVSRPAKSSMLLHVVVAWFFIGLIVVVSALLTTAICIGWPASLRTVLRSNVLAKNDNWKIKVFDFFDYGENAERNYVGQRFSAALLKRLTQYQVDVYHTTGVDPGNAAMSIVPMRGSAVEVDWQAYADLAPAIIVSGYVEDNVDGAGSYRFTVRATVIGPAATLQPIYQDSGQFNDTPDEIRQTAGSAAAGVASETQQYLSRMAR